MKEFQVRLFLNYKEPEKPKGIIATIINMFKETPKSINGPSEGDILELKIGKLSEHGYRFVNVYFEDEPIGEIRKSGIDELIEKGALENATFFGYKNNVPQVNIRRFEPHEYRDKPKYKEWRGELDKNLSTIKKKKEEKIPDELNSMINELSIETDPIKRHFIYQNAVRITYQKRKDTSMRSMCREVGKKHLSEFKELAPYIEKEFDGKLPRITTFQHLSTILSEDGDYDFAIDICKSAIQYGLDDGTKTGYEGRINRIKKKMLKHKR